MGKGLYFFRHNSISRLTFHVFLDDIGDEHDHEGTKRQVIRDMLFTVGTECGHDTEKRIYSDPYSKDSWYVPVSTVSNKLWDLVMTWQDGYIALTILPDLECYQKEIPQFRYNFFTTSANAFMQVLSKRLPLRPYAGPWTPGALIKEWNYTADSFKLKINQVVEIPIDSQNN